VHPPPRRVEVAVDAARAAHRRPLRLLLVGRLAFRRHVGGRHRRRRRGRWLGGHGLRRGGRRFLGRRRRLVFVAVPITVTVAIPIAVAITVTVAVTIPVTVAITVAVAIAITVAVAVTIAV